VEFWPLSAIILSTVTAFPSGRIHPVQWVLFLCPSKHFWIFWISSDLEILFVLISHQNGCSAFLQHMHKIHGFWPSYLHKLGSCSFLSLSDGSSTMCSKSSIFVEVSIWVPRLHLADVCCFAAPSKLGWIFSLYSRLGQSNSLSMLCEYRYVGTANSSLRSPHARCAVLQRICGYASSVGLWAVVGKFANNWTKKGRSLESETHTSTLFSSKFCDELHISDLKVLLLLVVGFQNWEWLLWGA
jgi:hypothetical protein